MVIAEWVWHSENAASGSFCSSGSVPYCTCKLLQWGVWKLQAPAPQDRSPKGIVATATAPSHKETCVAISVQFKDLPKTLLGCCHSFFWTFTYKIQHTKSSISNSENHSWQYLEDLNQNNTAGKGFQASWMGQVTCLEVHCLKPFQLIHEIRANLLPKSYKTLPWSEPCLSLQHQLLPILPQTVLQQHNCFLPHPVLFLPFVLRVTLSPSPSVLSTLSPQPQHGQPITAFPGSTSPSRKPLLLLRVNWDTFFSVPIVIWAPAINAASIPSRLWAMTAETCLFNLTYTHVTLPFVAWLLIGGGFDAGLLVGWRGTEKEVSPTGLSGLILPLLSWHAPDIKLELCVYFAFWRLEPLLSTQFLLCTFWLISDETSFLMHFWPLFRS